MHLENGDDSNEMSAPEIISTYKVLILGDCNVGKTCIVHRFCDERYYDTYISTIGVDLKEKIIQLDGIPVKLQIWDTAGQERFRTLTTAYYRGAMGILLMYDVTSVESFNNVPYWLKNVEENASPEVVKVLAGNKCEDATHRVVPTEDGERIANYFEMPFFEVSCKTNINVEEVFLSLAREIKRQKDIKEVIQNLNCVKALKRNGTVQIKLGPGKPIKTSPVFIFHKRKRITPRVLLDFFKRFANESAAGGIFGGKGMTEGLGDEYERVEGWSRESGDGISGSGAKRRIWDNKRTFSHPFSAEDTSSSSRSVGETFGEIQVHTQPNVENKKGNTDENEDADVFHVNQPKSQISLETWKNCSPC